jgi:hypothetical protein
VHSIPLLETEHIMKIEKFVINEKTSSRSNIHRENNLEETLDMKVIHDVFDANQMFLMRLI